MSTKPEPRVFYRTVVQVEILSEDPYGDEGKSLADIAYDIEEGGENGNVSTLVENEEIDEATAVRMLLDSGSDPSFFEIETDVPEEV